jgi:hypothetical protein
MSYSSVGVYTPATGAENATSGKVIASATWNSIFTDISTALTTVGSINANSLVGNNTGSTALAASLTVAQVLALIQPQSLVATALQAPLNLVSPADISIPVVLPSGVNNYLVTSLKLANASAAMTQGAVALFTAAGGTGVQLVVSTDVSITVAVSVSGNTQFLATTNANTQATNATTLYVRVMASCSAAADLIVNIMPLY